MLILRLIRLQRHRHRHLCRHPFKIPNALFSSLASPESQTPTTLNPMVKPRSLSERMSFVFEKIDAIEKERSQKDETLQRIRAWRESKKQTSIAADSSPAGSLDSDQNVATKEDENEGVNTSILSSKKELELSHPWPEWVELMERLVTQNYFDHRRKDEDKMLENSGFSISEMVEEDGFDFTRDLKTVLNAVLNFGNDRFDILRSLSRQDLQLLVGYGCPSVDKRVVSSSKLLRKHTNLDEGDVCSSCSLRSSCEKAFLLTHKEEEARTIDVMRLLVTYAFGAIGGTAVNESLLNKKALKNSIRKLLHQVVKLSAVSIDPHLPPPIKRKPPPKVKQPPTPPRKRVGRDDVEMKKGDWLCTKCDFMNFAKNTVCLQCDAKRPKRQLLPGEWECPQCNFLNYRRNVVCFHCEHKRPQDDYMENQMQERPYQQRSPRSNEKIPNRRADVSDAWNFDFDENESDGADVAAFEYADSHKLNQDFPLEKGLQEEDKYKPGSSRLGFNDFDDEEDDDIGNYELDNQNEGKTVPRIDLSELEVDDSLSENEERPRNNRRDHRPSNSRDQRKHGPDDFNSDDDLLNHPNWKSSHVMQFDQKNKRRGGGGDMSFGSDDDELSSDDDLGTQKKMNQKRNPRLKYSSETDDDGIEDDFPSSRRGKGIKSSPRKPKKTVGFDSDDEPFSDVESDNEDGRFNRGRGGGGQRGRGRNSSFSDVRSDNDSRFNRGRGGGGGQRGRGRNSSFSDVESDDDGCFNRGRGGGGQRGRGRNSSFSDVESDDDGRFNRGRGGGGGQRGRGRNSSFSDVESDDDGRFNRGRGGGGGGGQRGRGRNSSFSSRKDNFSRGGSSSRGKSFEKYEGKRRNGRDDDDGDFKNARNRGRGGGRSSFDRKSSGRSDYNDNNNKGGSYLDDERYRKPRNNVR